MELPLNDLPTKREDLLSVGADYAHDISALCNDVAAMVFPSALAPPTEAIISAVTAKLLMLVHDIEQALWATDVSKTQQLPSSWPLLARSGFLREPDLIDFILARVAEDRLDAKTGDRVSQLPPLLLDHPISIIASAARNLLAADSLHRRTGLSYQALRPELLHRLCWRVVAAIEVDNGKRDQSIVQNARLLLSQYDEGQTAQAAANKLTHLLDSEYHTDLSDPEKAGLHLYVAQLAQTTEIEHDHVLRLIDSHSSAPLSIMLKATDKCSEQAMETIYLFKGFGLTPREVAMFERDYEALEIDVAQAEIQRWGFARAQYLAFNRGS